MVICHFTQSCSFHSTVLELMLREDLLTISSITFPKTLRCWWKLSLMANSLSFAKHANEKLHPLVYTTLSNKFSGQKQQISPAQGNWWALWWKACQKAQILFVADCNLPTIDVSHFVSQFILHEVLATPHNIYKHYVYITSWN